MNLKVCKQIPMLSFQGENLVLAHFNSENTIQLHFSDLRSNWQTWENQFDEKIHCFDMQNDLLSCGT